MTASMRFLGAAGTVTGPRHLVSTPKGAVLVSAGPFQAAKEVRLRGRAPFPVAAPPSVHAMVLTVARVHHPGALRHLAREGFRGPVYWTPAMRDLALRFCGHGEPAAFAAVAARPAARGSTAIVPRHGEEVPLA